MLSGPGAETPSRSETEAVVGGAIEDLRDARRVFQIELERCASARALGAERLKAVRTMADTLAVQADATLSTRAGDAATQDQISEVEELRLFFRLAAGCVSVLLRA